MLYVHPVECEASFNWGVLLSPTIDFYDLNDFNVFYDYSIIPPFLLPSSLARHSLEGEDGCLLPSVI
jgi:hypothetical protein